MASQTEIIFDLKDSIALQDIGLFVNTASKFGSYIKITKYAGENKTSADAKSVLGIASLGLKYGDKIRIKATGRDAELATTTLAKLMGE